MADVTGIFKADFSSFFDAVEQSQVKLKGLESDSSKVEGNLSRMANAFSGQKIIQEATMMAEIFERAGGASAFTEKELARMGATGAEAVEKLKALGKEVPEGIQKIADESKQADTATAGWGAAIGKVAAGYLSMQGLQKVWGFAQEIMADADALEDLSAQTRINTTDLQNLGNTMQGFGIDMDEMGRAIFGLSKRIGSGDDSVNDALRQMGLSIEAVKNLQPVDMFLTITDAAGKMNEQFRDTALATLFGDKLGQAMGGAAGKIREAYDEQIKLNRAIGPDAIKALAESNDAIEQFYIQFKAKASTALAAIITGAKEYYEVAQKAGPVTTAWARFLDSLTTSAGETGTRFNALKTEVDALNPAQLENTQNVNNLIRGYDGLAPAIASTAGETARLREEEKRLHDQRFNPAETLSGFEEATRVAAQKQIDIDNEIAKTRELQTAKQEAHNTQMAAGAGYVAKMGEIAKVNKEAADFEKGLLADQQNVNAENAKLIESWGAVGESAAEAGAKGAEGGAATAQAWVGVQQQVELSSDGIRGWIELMRYTDRANAILMENSLFTTSGQLQRIAAGYTGGSLSAFGAPSFAGGIQNFAGGLAKVHGGEVLANLPPGTSVFPRGQGLGATVNNTFNLVDSESNLARRVAELIMRNIRAGAQLGTA